MAKRIKFGSSKSRSRATRKRENARRKEETVEVRVKEDYLAHPDVLYESAEDDFSILKLRYDVVDAFPDAALKEAREIASHPVPSDEKGRLDLRGETIITIDGETAKDFDDAVSLEWKDGEWHLGVHIADVGHFVRSRSALDKVARRRGTSIYLVEHVIPMLPEELSNDLCSLRQGEDRLTFSCLLRYDERGRRKGWQFKKSVIRSRRRCTYTEIQSVIEKKTTLGADIDALAVRMYDFMKLLRRNRLEAGAIDLEGMDLYFDPLPGGKISSIRPRGRLEAEMLIEEFMLAANVAAAESLEAAGRGVYRIHEAPDKEKLDRYLDAAARRGWHIPPSNTLNPLLRRGPNGLMKLLESVPEGEPRKVWSFLLLTSFMQARYGTANLGHYGLGFPAYTHFTSPIRRYPDLLVHRLLASSIRSEVAPHPASELSEMSTTSSREERRAVTMEREYHKIKMIRYLEGRIGERYDAVILGAIPRGLFARHPGTGIEGFVDSSDLERFTGESLRFDEKKLAFTAAKGEVRFQVGDRIRIELVAVSPARLHIDFRPVEAEASAGAPGTER